VTLATIAKYYLFKLPFSPSLTVGKESGNT